MMNPQLSGVPFDVKNQVIQTMFMVSNIKFDESEMSDLGQAVNAEVTSMTQHGLGFMSKHKNALKGIGDLGKAFK